jgi:hypothetical protein
MEVVVVDTPCLLIAAKDGLIPIVIACIQAGVDVHRKDNVLIGLDLPVVCFSCFLLSYVF